MHRNLRNCTPWICAVISIAGPALAEPTCTVGQRVIADGHPATVLDVSSASCRVHYEDGAYSDGWTYKFSIKAADQDAKNAATASAGPRLGRYTITVGSGLYTGYLQLTSASSYELFLPGGKSGGKGQYAFDRTAMRVRWLSGPMSNPGWDGTQKLEGDGAMLKIRIGARAVATNSGH